MENNQENKRKDTWDFVNQSKNARIFIMVLGIVFIILSIMLLKITAFIGASMLVLGIWLLWCSRFGSVKFIQKMEKVLTGT